MFARRIHSHLFFLSLANLLFIRSWSVLFNSTREEKLYYLPYVPDWEPFAAVVVEIAAAAFLLAMGHRLLNRRHPEIAAWACYAATLAVLMIASFGLRSHLPFLRIHFLRDVHGGAIYPVSAAVFCLSIFLAIRFRRKLMSWVQILVLCLSPLAFWTLSQAGYRALAGSGPSTPVLSARGDAADRGKAERGKPKFIWIIFDEADQRLMFEGRPGDLELPALDSLKARSFSASQALPPSDNTMISLPSLISGRQFHMAHPAGAQELSVAGPSRKKVQWPDEDQLFAHLKSRNARISLVGWYHPYCRLFGKYLEHCIDGTPSELFTGDGLGFWLGKILLHNFESHNFFLLQNSHGLTIGNPHVSNHRKILQSALRAANDGSDFVFIHWSIPHRPYIYDRFRKNGGFVNSQNPKDYPDNLALMDRSLAEIIGNLQASGKWDSTTFILSSDHWWRNSRAFDGIVDHRVPFLVKLPGSNLPVDYDRPFNTIITRELILALYDGHINDPRQLVEWMDANAESSAPVFGAGGH